MKTKIKAVGNSTGLILPSDLLTRLRLERGDDVVISETPNGFTVTRQDDVFERAMASARAGMKRYRKALAELAK
jgi:putative addiction module antidote